MNYVLTVDELQIPITNFSENLSEDGTLTFNVTATELTSKDMSSFRNLAALQASMADGHLNMSVSDDNGVVWESDAYVLQNASMSANEIGMYFSAFFIQNRVVTE